MADDYLRAERNFTIEWVASNTLAGGFGLAVLVIPLGIVLVAFDGSHREAWPYFLYLFLAGVLVLVVQATVLSKYVTWARWWGFASVAGAVAGMAVVVVVYPAAWGSVYASLDGPDMPTRNSDLTGRGNYFSDHVFAVKDPEPYLQFDFGVEIGLATDRVVSTATAERQRASRGAFDLRTAQAMGVAGAVGATLFAACVAIPQSLVLRPSVPRAYRWIPASTGCALVASACFGIAAVVDASIWGGTDGYSVLGYGGHLGLLVAALVFFSITGRVLDRLLREPYHEGEEHGGR